MKIIKVIKERRDSKQENKEKEKKTKMLRWEEGFPDFQGLRLSGLLFFGAKIQTSGLVEATAGPFLGFLHFSALLCYEDLSVHVVHKKRY